jgi:RNA polymerase-associated protein RTF1
MQLTEIDREAEVAQRLDQMQRIIDKRNLDQMLNAQQNRNSELDSVSKAAKRLLGPLLLCYEGSLGRLPRAGQHTIKGATKEKSRKLDELKAKRKAKGEKKRVCSLVNFY